MKELDAFTAGWLAAGRHHDHEWGPAPPDNPADAKRLWEQTCAAGHVVRVKGCKPCNYLMYRPKNLARRNYVREK